MSSTHNAVSDLSPEALQALADRLLQQRKATPAAATSSIPEGTPVPLSYAQEALWLVERLGTATTAYNETVTLRFEGDLDVAALERSLGAVVQRQGALRAFVTTGEDGTPRQVIAPAEPLVLEVLERPGIGAEALQDELRALADRPFDLAQPPLFRGTLVRLSPQTNVLLWSVHHLIWDEWSVKLFLVEFGAHYAAFVQGQDAPGLPPVALQYADFAAWQRDHVTRQSLEQQREYWRRTLAGAPTLLPLPTDRARPARRTFHGGNHVFALPQRVTATLEAAARGAGATLYMTLLALYQALLARLSGIDDIVVRSPTSGRTHPQVSGVIGLFVNMLPLRSVVRGADTFQEHLARVRQGTLDALGNQSFPYEWLVSALVRTRDLSHEPIAQADFVLREGQVESGVLPGLTVLPLETTHSGAINDLAWIVQPEAQGLKCEFVYATDLFDPQTVDDFAQRLVRLATSIADAPERRLDEIDLRLPYAPALAGRRYPLAAAQQILLRQLRFSSSGLQAFCFHIDLTDEQEVAQWQQAALTQVASNPALRLRFERIEGGRVLQYMDDGMPIEVAQLDLIGVSDIDAAATRAVEDFSIGMDEAARTSAFAVLLLRLDESSWRLVCRYHPLAFDEAQVRASIRALTHGALTRPAQGDDIDRHLQAEREWRYGPRSEAAREFWSSALVDSVAVAFAMGSRRGVSGSPMRLRTELPAVLIEGIDACARHAGCRVADLMFAMAALYVQRATATQRPRVGALARLSSADTPIPSQAWVPITVVADPAAAVIAGVHAVLAQRQQSEQHARDFALLQDALLAADEAAFRVAIEVGQDAQFEVPSPSHDLRIRCVLDDDGRCAALELRAPPGQHEPWELQSLLDALVNFLHAVCSAPTAPVQGALLMGAEQRACWLAQVCGAPSIDVGEEWVHERFVRQARLTPDAAAVCCGGQELSYAELDRRSDQFASYLVAQGVRPDGVVGLFLERSIELMVAILATLKAGAAYLPIDTESPEARIAHVLLNAHPALLVTTTSQAARLVPTSGELKVCLIDVEDFSGCSTAGATRVRGGHLAYLLYTSGSTGQPKGVETSHAALLNRLSWMQAEYEIGAGDRVLQKTPYTFDVSVWELLWPLMAGACVVFAKPGGHRDAEYLHRLLREERISVAHFVPSMLAAFLSHSPTVDCPTLRHLICSGEALSAALVQRFHEGHVSARLHNLYGPTEAAIDATYFECPRAAAVDGVPIGRAIWNTRIYVLDERLEPVPPGFTGDLYIGGAGLARCYRQRPDLSADRFIADPFEGAGARMYRTGDVARYRADGLIDYLGRRDHQVKIRGVRIELGEIEALLVRHPQVREAVVRPVESDTDLRLVGYVIAEGDAPVLADELRAHLKLHLPESMLPSAFVAVAAWPVSTNGKLDPRRLPAPDPAALVSRSHEPSQGESESPKGETEATLAAIWTQLLQVEQVGRRDNFFELGGHSLLGIQVLARVRTQLEVTLPFDALFECRDLEALARRIDAIRWSKQSETDDPDDGGDARERLVL